MSAEKKKKTSSSAGWHIAGLVAALICLLAPFVYLQRSEYDIQAVEQAAPTFAGSEKCASCHRAAYEKWQGSHHDLAMDVASEETVLGDFGDTIYSDPHNGVTSRFFREQGKFLVETEGPDGKLGTFPITHTFGVYPVQQYLVPFPGGRLQCLNIGWDSRDNRWYRMPPYEVKGPGDWLHWTNGGQTWNSMCAECHSTRLEKGYDMESQAYDTRWFEIHVGCEACHGPGSGHVEWAEIPGIARPEAANAKLQVETGNTNNRAQIAICAPCHARRYQLGDNEHSEGELLDKLIPSLLEEGLYFADGQILEEVYVYGSFTQSKMYRLGVSCSDCHDMHSLKLHGEGNTLCLQCHRAESYDTPAHHFHKREYQGKPSNGHLCVKCHLPGQVYMGTDYRPDHSLRIPRPDLSETIGVPNSCSAKDCHGDKSLAWVNEHFTKWYGSSRKPHYGEVFTLARSRQPEAREELMNIAEDGLLTPIVRATALSLLSSYPGEGTAAVFTRALDDDEALVRHTAIRHLNSLHGQAPTNLLVPKLYDEVKAVRIEAAIALARIPIESIRPEHRTTFAQVLEEYRQAMVYNSDFAPQRYNLGNLAALQGETDMAIERYRQAIQIEDQFYQAKVNLAMQLNSRGRNDEAADLFRQVVEAHPEMHQVSYSYGLLLAEMKQYREATRYLGKAADGMPENSRARYNQALAFLKLQQWEKGETALLKALEAEPANQEYFTTLVQLYLNFRMNDRARQLAEYILAKEPNHELAKQILETLRQIK